MFPALGKKALEKESSGKGKLWKRKVLEQNSSEKESSGKRECWERVLTPSSTVSDTMRMTTI